ncbi:hypothetical protein [Allochromatium vinosum]|uniref:hypothetical protein n=1 Tax=Allochromatium vinosum TaxID=1049 RepID=UPI0019082723|nr:hypothetical protein [Allochromatium vinosum]
MLIISENRLRRIWHSIFTVLGKKLIVININYMGLGNRLKLLASYHINYGLDDATLLWNRSGWVNSRLSDIICIDGVNNFKEYSMPLNGLFPPIITHPEKKTFRERAYWRFDVNNDLPDDFLITRWGKTFPAIDFCFERTPKKYIDLYLAFFSKLKPSGAVRNRIDEVQLTTDDVCVQVRNTIDPEDRKDVPTIESIVDCLRSFPVNKRFFISTLDQSISRVFYEEFPGRILELPSKQYRSMIDAAADLYLLSLGGTLLCSHGSTFGELAWWLGGGRQKVIMMTAENIMTPTS